MRTNTGSLSEARWGGGAKTIVKALMPRKDPEKKTSEYTAKYKCGDLGGSLRSVKLVLQESEAVTFFDSSKR